MSGRRHLILSGGIEGIKQHSLNSLLLEIPTKHWEVHGSKVSLYFNFTVLKAF